MSPTALHCVTSVNHNLFSLCLCSRSFFTLGVRGIATKDIQHGLLSGMLR